MDCFGPTFTGKPAASWLSLGFEDLALSLHRSRLAGAGAPDKGGPEAPFDVLIVGSGYGGAMAAAELAGSEEPDGQGRRKITVAMLERGREYLPGAFPGGFDEFAGHVRFSVAGTARPRGRLEGLFDFKVGPDVNALVANGLGGGSLINAGVMLRPSDAILDSGSLPPDLRDYYERAELALGVRGNQYGNGIPAPRKAEALRKLAPGKHRFVPISVGLEPGAVTSANVRLERCIECGDCATGCNFGAKNSLDTNLLVRAVRNGLGIYTGATVLRIERRSPSTSIGWIVHAVPTDRAMRERHGEPLRVHARRLVLAAGTFGSTEILMRSRSEEVKFSRMLGQKFSSNGDMLAAVYDHDDEANAVAREGKPPCDRGVGPTITSMLDLRDTDGFAIQEMAIPGAMERPFEESVTTSWLLHQLDKPDKTVHTGDEQGIDPIAVHPDRIARSSIIAIMGDDGAAGSLEMAGGADEGDGDGAVGVRWPALKEGPFFDRQIATLDRLVKDSPAGGTALPNPLWRLLPPSMDFLMDGARGPALTVHPLGGCAMASTADDGVVNFEGRVFDAAGSDRSAVFKDLVVLDGSIVPRALAINPGLTIAALALRATEKLRADWELSAPPVASQPVTSRPYFQKKSYVREPAPTFAVAERLSGEIVQPGTEGKPRGKCFVELTLQYTPSALLPLMSSMERHLVVDGKSRVRVFESRAAYEGILAESGGEPDVEKRLDRKALRNDPVEGTLKFFHREPSTPWRRRARGLWGYIRNRAARDICAAIRDKDPKNNVSPWTRIRGAFDLASRAGEVRLFEYVLDARPAGGTPYRIEGRKRLTYGARTNLWEQLETLALTEFGGKASGSLEIDFKYFAAAATPLARIYTQPNMPRSLLELGAFFGYLTRLMVSIHMWSFRRPDAPRPRAPQRLPGIIDRPWYYRLLGLAPDPPLFYEIVVGTLPIGYPVKVRLTRYARFESTEPPVLLIHGYSASGTTFAHTAVRPNLVERLWRSGRDVWVIDMRTSAGFLTAAWPWAFEDPALADIPAAIDRMLAETGKTQVDVVAHCMGAAMFSMALLKPPLPADPYFGEREALPQRVRRVVLSQVGPLMDFAPINVFRGYVMRYARHFLGISAFEFRIQDAPSVAEQLLDRFLSTLKYPMEERRIESPLFGNTEFVGTRHRMDSLYGRTFSLANLSREVLHDIDDFFGPLNLATVSQALHFAHEHVLTDRHGRNVFLTLANRNDRWLPETLTLHAEENGLVDKTTRGRIDRYFNRSHDGQPDKERIQQASFDGVGHQDSMIGKPSVTAPIFDKIVEFLGDGHKEARAQSVEKKKWLAVAPWIGPHRSIERDRSSTVTLAVAADRKLGDPALVVAVAVALREDRYHEVSIASGVPGMANGSQYLFDARPDKDGWLSIDLPDALLASTADGILLLLLYDQPRAMLDTTAEDFARFREQLANINDEGGPVPAQLSALPLTAPVFQIENLLARLPKTVIQPKAPVVVLPATEPGTVPKSPAPGSLFQKLPGSSIHLEQLTHVRADFLWPNAVWTLLIQLAMLYSKLPFLDSIVEDVREALRQPAAALKSGFIATSAPQAGAAQRPVARLFVGSCQYPAGLLDAEPTWASYRKLGTLLEAPEENCKSVLLLLGDQIYSDASAGVFDPVFADDKFRRTHEALFSRPEVGEVLKRAPAVMMLDDHELGDNWEPHPDLPRSRDRIREGLQAYKDFQRRAGPLLEPRTPAAPDPLWTCFHHAGLSVFVADTRTDRAPRRVGELQGAMMMSVAQHDALLACLKEAERDAPKFVACPAILLPRRLETQRSILGVGAKSIAGPMRVDAWEGYPGSMARLFRDILDNEIRNVIFLSGDEHLFCLARAVLEGGGKRQVIHSIHSSSLYSPFPFANAVPAEFKREEDRFIVPCPEDRAAPIQCTAEPPEFFPIANGFVEVNAWREKDWVVEVSFHDAGPGTSPLVRRLSL